MLSKAFKGVESKNVISMFEVHIGYLDVNCYPKSLYVATFSRSLSSHLTHNALGENHSEIILWDLSTLHSLYSHGQDEWVVVNYT